MEEIVVAVGAFPASQFWLAHQNQYVVPAALASERARSPRRLAQQRARVVGVV